MPDLVPADQLPSPNALPAPPALFSDRRADHRFWEFFTANIRNSNTRRAYLRAAVRFSAWCEARALHLEDLDAIAVAAYIEDLSRAVAPATVKQHLAAIRMLFDWLVLGHVVRSNPATAVRGPKHVVRTGKTPVLSAEEARALLDAVDTRSVIGLRDRALIGVMVYGFARISAALAMRVADYYTQGKRSFLRLQEKGGRHSVVPAHHLAQEYLDAYLDAAALSRDRTGHLFRACGRARRDPSLSTSPLTRRDALAMIKRRARQAHLPDEISPHSFRATGITEYLRNGGELEIAARIAGHESTRTTQLYNRVDDEISLDEIERIHI